jgi:hypothetical protein
MCKKYQVYNLFMAKLEVIDGNIFLKLSKLEVLGACHRSLRMPMSELLEMKMIDNPWTSETMRGMRAPGTGIPYIIMLGTLRNLKGWKAFCAIYKKKPVVVLSWKSGSFNQWIVTANQEELPKSLVN